MIKVDNYPLKRYIFGVDDAAAATAASAIIGAGTSAAAQSSMNKKTREFNKEEAEKQRQWSEQMYNAQNAWNYEMWLKTNEYNSPEAQVKRLRDAGLNPIYYGLDGSSANGIQAAQPLSYERAKADDQPNPFEGLSRAAIDSGNMLLQGKLAEKDMELKNAQIDKLKEDAEGVKLDNEWKDKTMQARVESEELANSLTKKNIAAIDEEINKKKQEVKKLVAETENEVERKGYIMAQTALANAQAKQIVELLPYEKNLKEAQTIAQKAAAAASWANAAVQNGLLEAGYVDKVIDDLTEGIRLKKGNADIAEINKAIVDFKRSVRDGTVFVTDAYADPVRGFFQDALGSLVSALAITSEAIGGSISGLLK